MQSMSHITTTSRSHRSTAHVLVLLIAVSLTMVAMIGCDDRPTRVLIAGQVLIDGQPLTHGNIRFIPKKARPSMADIDDTGHFQLSCFEGGDGAVLGVHQIEVSAGERVSETKVHWYAPKKYAHAATSGLTETISQPNEAVVINLTWDGGKPFDETLALEEEGGPRSSSARQ